MDDQLNGSHRNGPKDGEDGEILPEIRPELVEMAIETKPTGLTAEELRARKQLEEVLERNRKDKELDEKLGKTKGLLDPRTVAAATGAPVERIMELQALPKPLPEFDRLTGDPEIDALYRDCLKCFAEKGEEYTVGSKDRLANFRGVAEDVGIPMEKAWYVFFNKHLRALQSYIKNGCYVKSNEPIQSRIMDLIVYLTLFHKMSLEIERKRAAEAGVVV